MRKSTSQDELRVIQEYSTQHIFCAAFLISRGHRITRIDNDARKSTIHFEGTNVENDALDFFNGTATKVNPKTFADSYRHIKDLIFQEK